MNTKDLIHALHSTQSRSKRALLDAAADTIEALLEDLRDAANDPCHYCKYVNVCVEPDCSDDRCGPSVKLFEWRGINGEEVISYED